MCKILSTRNRAFGYFHMPVSISLSLVVHGNVLFFIDGGISKLHMPTNVTFSVFGKKSPFLCSVFLSLSGSIPLFLMTILPLRKSPNYSKSTFTTYDL